MADVIDELEDAAKGPRRVMVDGNSAERQDLEQTIAADEYLQSRSVTRAGKTGLRFATLKFPGAA